MKTPTIKMIYYAPIPFNNTCICFDCVRARGWLDRHDNLLNDVEL